MKRTLKRLHDPTWLVLPDDVDRQIDAWRRLRSAMPVDTIIGFTGLECPRPHPDGQFHPRFETRRSCSLFSRTGTSRLKRPALWTF